MVFAVTLEYGVKRDRRIDEVPDIPEECALPEGSRGHAYSRRSCKVQTWQFLSEGARRLEDESEEEGGELTYDGVRQTWGGALPPGTTERVLGQIGNFRVARQLAIEAISEDTRSLNVRQARLPQSLCQTLHR